MIRQWTPQDLSAIADIWLDHRSKSQWGKWTDIHTPKEDVIKWLVQCIMDYHYTAFVKLSDEGLIIACVGANLVETPHPPHLRQVSEWCMWGDNPRDLVELWVKAKEWGKGRGAILAQRGKVEHDKQYVKWERI